MLLEALNDGFAAMANKSASTGSKLTFWVPKEYMYEICMYLYIYIYAYSHNLNVYLYTYIRKQYVLIKGTYFGRF